MAESKLAGPIKLCKQQVASYNVFSVVLVFSMLSLGCILISDLVANLLMYSLPTLLGHTFFTSKVFLDEIAITYTLTINSDRITCYHSTHTHSSYSHIIIITIT